MTVDLTHLTADELKAELQRREQVQNENRQAYKALVNESIPQIIGKLQTYSEQMAEVKLHTFEALKIRKTKSTRSRATNKATPSPMSTATPSPTASASSTIGTTP